MAAGVSSPACLHLSGHLGGEGNPSEGLHDYKVCKPHRTRAHHCIPSPAGSHLGEGFCLGCFSARRTAERLGVLCAELGARCYNFTCLYPLICICSLGSAGRYIRAEALGKYRPLLSPPINPGKQSRLPANPWPPARGGQGTRSRSSPGLQGNKSQGHWAHCKSRTELQLPWPVAGGRWLWPG